MKKQYLPNVNSSDQTSHPAFREEGVLIESHPVSTCEKVKEFRGNLIANVSHDLRTPLQSIIGYSESILLKQGDISKEEQKKYLDIILANANKLSSMIEQFFEYSKLEVSEIIPEKAPFVIEKLVQDLPQNYKLISSKRKVEISVQIEDSLAPIYGDYLMICRVFQNMIDNAFKFTPEGGTIKIHLAKYSDKELQVQISDTGAGIPRKDLDSIFNKFQTTKETASSIEKNDGIGLGLAIVKKILTLHDAEIFVHSKFGEGTTFTFFLPFYQA